MKRVIGLGGIFFKSDDPSSLRNWYKKHLGLNVEDWGCKFEWRNPNLETGEAYSVWSPLKHDTNYFAPSAKPFMINFVVQNLTELLNVLRTEGVHVFEETDESEFGKFGWILDPENNKIELWEPPAKGN